MIASRNAGIGRGVAAVALLGTLALGIAPARIAFAHSAHGHPAKIHNGSCEDLKGVAFELNGVGGEVDVAGNPVPKAVAVNEDSAYQVLLSTTAIAAGIEDLLAEPRAVMVYQSDEELTGIACGNLGGARLGDELAVALGEVNVPGHVGFAVVRQDPANAGETTVTVYIGHALSPVSMGGATDASHSHDAEDAGHMDHADGEATPAAEESGHGHGSDDHHDEEAAATPSA